MRILRSQYLKSLALNNNGIEIIQNKGEKHVNDEDAHGLTKASMTLRRRKTVDFCTTTSSANATNIKILINNLDDSLQKLNIIVEFTDIDALWLTRVYKTYENDLWHKEHRLNVFGKKKYFFYCGLCSNMYKQFSSIKSHLNLHFDFYPYVCKLCPKKYTNRKAATNHLKSSHKLGKVEWNDFLTS